jgi:thiol-disulfide isomerase/thioredoxin
VRRAPLVLALFATSSADCEHEVDTLQALAQEFPRREVQFAAVAIHASHTATASAVRAHRWTIPVAYDRDGAIGVVYDAEICPLLELAYRGGVVADRLIGDHWLSAAALGARVRALLNRGPA